MFFDLISIQFLNDWNSEPGLLVKNGNYNYTQYRDHEANVND